MTVVGNDQPELQIFTEFREIIARHTGRPTRLAVLERFAFHQRGRQAFVIVATSESRFSRQPPP